jgi:lipid-binding SYLF domain-containing protein
MLKRLLIAASAAAFLTLGSFSAAQEVDSKVAKERSDIDERAEDALAEFLANVEGGQALYDKATGYATFRVTKAGLGVSGAGGQGVAVNKSSGARVYMNMGAAGAGLTFGASRYDIVIVFETADRLNAFMSGGWDSAATAQAAAGSESTGVGATFFEGVAYFQIEDKGLMASADVTGTRFWVSEDLN